MPKSFALVALFAALAPLSCSQVKEAVKRPSPAAVVLEARAACYLYELNPSIPRDPDVSELCSALLERCDADAP